MHSHRSPRFSLAAACDATEHPAEAFLRAAGLNYAHCIEDPAILLLSFTFEHDAVRAALHRHPEQTLMIFNLSLPQRPCHSNAARETARLCHFLNENLSTGRFALDELDGEITFRSGHFYGPEELQTDAFAQFFDHCMVSIAVALPAFQAVTTGAGTAPAALALALPPSTS